MENVFLLVGLSPLLIVLAFMCLRCTREGKWFADLAGDWIKVLKRKSPPDDQQK
ncbi:MAG TPA: hypothetical protein VGO52_14145 [Hyphomonadaceae bacterium]|nr:hypothetical protein [Hyphomonadaceae bacterium]